MPFPPPWSIGLLEGRRGKRESGGGRAKKISGLLWCPRQRDGRNFTPPKAGLVMALPLPESLSKVLLTAVISCFSTFSQDQRPQTHTHSSGCHSVNADSRVTWLPSLPTKRDLGWFLYLCHWNRFFFIQNIIDKNFRVEDGMTFPSHAIYYTVCLCSILIFDCIQFHWDQCDCIAMMRDSDSALRPPFILS